LWQTDSIVDLRANFPEIPDIGELFFEEVWPSRPAHSQLPGQPMDVRFGPPVARPTQIICVGENYIEHANEDGVLD
jgi:2-keto-4-pentenoate hydratase/2-oxohepta-3-ene-1,7-dioic acid hydratase in catechol pathway